MRLRFKRSVEYPVRKVPTFIWLIVVVAILSGCASNPSAPGIKKAESKPTDERAMLHVQLAKGYMEQNQLATAKKELEKALQLDSRHSDSNYVMGLLMLKLKQNDDAAFYLERAVSSDRSNSAAAHDYGMLLCQTGKEKKSVDYFEIAASNPLFARSELSFMRAGECLARVKDERAERYLRRALSTNPKLRPALYQLAILKRSQGNNLSARAYIERYMAITKPQPQVLLLAYQIESSLRATEVAEKYRKQILRDFPGSEAAEIVRGQ